MQLLKMVADLLGKAVNRDDLPHLNGLAAEVQANPHDHVTASIFYDALDDAGITPELGRHPMHWSDFAGEDPSMPDHPLHRLYHAALARETSQFDPRLEGLDLERMARNHIVPAHGGIVPAYWTHYPEGTNSSWSWMSWRAEDSPIHDQFKIAQANNEPINEAWLAANPNDYRNRLTDTLSGIHPSYPDARRHWYENVYKPRVLAERG